MCATGPPVRISRNFANSTGVGIAERISRNSGLGLNSSSRLAGTREKGLPRLVMIAGGCAKPVKISSTPLSSPPRPSAARAPGRCPRTAASRRSASDNPRFISSLSRIISWPWSRLSADYRPYLYRILRPYLRHLPYRTGRDRAVNTSAFLSPSFPSRAARAIVPPHGGGREFALRARASFGTHTCSHSR